MIRTFLPALILAAAACAQQHVVKDDSPTPDTAVSSPTTSSPDAATDPKPVTGERLTPSEIGSTIRERRDDVRVCEHDENRDQLTGVIEVIFTIHADGSVDNVIIQPRHGTNFLDTDIGRCVQKVVETFRFRPRIDFGQIVIVSYPFRVE